MSTPARLEAVRDALRRHGVTDCQARASGIDGEVLLLAPSRLSEDQLLDSPVLLEELRANGFRYVALDLAPLG